MSGSVRARMTLFYGGLFTLITVGVLLGALGFQIQALNPLFDGRNDRVGGAGHHGDSSDRPDGTEPWMEGVPCALRSGLKLADCTTLPYDRGKTAAAQSELFGDEPADGVQEQAVRSQRLVILSAIAVIAVLGFALSWWLTGRLLRPLHRITAAAQRLSLSTLHERIGLTGPDDELRRLADTFDAMLDRLQRAVDSQRRFVANASHELRTPLAVQRTAIEVGLARPTPERVERIRDVLLRNTLRSERLIAGLLLLAKGERGLDDHTPVELSAVVTEVVEENRGSAEAAGVTLTPPVLDPVVVLGDEVLLGQLVTNLVQNAIRYNVPGGRVTIVVSPGVELVISNTGPQVPPDRAAELFEPFRRLDADRTGADEGAGLGLSIVAAIARAHGGTVTLRPNPDGGITVRVELPEGR
ncbi:sensor histidine kinase [Actinoplanes regularis]|uniref:sensor histidine kinase n=1 Tax=Actinoplanes regularis TaxID=52697 RepID=UPI0024A071C3|nr:HAMP domain-containing sensor histidine kinase [Actinoplanes regularis]GLW33635.1 two-component sensor histidine kinase [Actinoplanes regularis]